MTSEPRIVTPKRLETAQQTAIRDLAQAATTADRVAPLNEEALLRLDDDQVGHVLVESGGQLAGYAQSDPAGSSQLVVAPAQRRQGLGRALLDEVLRRWPATAIWAFGNLQPARRLLTGRGFTPVRELVVMERDLPADLAAPAAPADVTIRGFQPGDEAAVLGLNAAAFADHPEQGRLDLAGLRQRLAQDWFDPAGLLLAFGPDQSPLGFHWTKRHPAGLGEVYVIGVAPAAAGQGLGRTLLTTGLAHLAGSGCRQVRLWVEADNTAAVSLYRTAGFSAARSDVHYARRENP